MHNKITLIGFMGSGKSSVALQLGKKIHQPILESDELLLADSGFSSISEIFSQKGEDYFRTLETNTLKQLAELENGIISTGGGVVVKKENLPLLKKNSYVIYLKTSFETISERIGNASTRPLFKNRQKAYDLYRLRELKYTSMADLIISTDTKSAKMVANEIVVSLQGGTK